MKKIFFLFVFLFSSLILINSEIIILADGSKIEGEIELLENDQIKISSKNQVYIYQKDEIEIILKDQKDFEKYIKKIKKIYEKNYNWKKHFIEITVIGGPAFYTNYSINNSIGKLYTDYGGLIGGSFGYQYAISKNFAIGCGLSGFGSIIYHKNESLKDFLGEASGMDIEPYYNGMTSGITAMIQLLFGDLYKHKIAYQFEFGGGLGISLKMGLYIKGFLIKFGYHITYNFSGHNVLIDIGYKLNFKSKKNVM